MLLQNSAMCHSVHTMLKVGNAACTNNTNQMSCSGTADRETHGISTQGCMGDAAHGSSIPAAAEVPAPLATATSPKLANESVVATTPTKHANMMPAARNKDVLSLLFL